ncbi:MAG: hypothetical protein PUB67_04555 [Clostridiales bacterium]|nr:hypothetical protein [Clostridiales bacterium]
MIHKKLLRPLLAAGCILILCACGRKADNPDDSGKATPDNATTATPFATATPTSTPIPTPTPIPNVPEWEYKIIQGGYYNACAKWDEKGALKENAEFKNDSQVYFNDCDEYYDNFIDKGNVFGEALLTLDDLVHHSGDNSAKITNRLSSGRGFSGFALKLNKANALDGLYKLNFDGTLDLWIYYQDDFNNQIDEVLTFCAFINHTDEKKILSKDDILSEITDSKIKTSVNNTLLAAEKSKFKPVFTFKVQKNTWTRVHIPVSITGRSDIKDKTDTMIAISTLGEIPSANVSFYNPFYVDDISLLINKIHE